jgi:tartrate dehydrogenase/decarboxylase/D-malate dehydrogenase
MTTHKIAVIPGDGIGKEVVPEGLRVLEIAASRFGIDLAFDHFDFASCDYYARHGTMMPTDWKDQIGGHDAIYFGAVGWPDAVPDHISLWGSLLLFRREFDQYVNLRPVRLMPGVPCPLVGRKPGDIDFYVVRENTEGEYSSIGGRAFPGTDREVVLQESVFTRHGTDRIIRYAFELAKKRKKQLTTATKSNGIFISMPYWDERVEAVSADYPDVAVKKFHIDILSAHFVRNPHWFDVVVASNLFGDILSDLGPACTDVDLIQNEVYAAGKDAGFEPLRGWFAALYEVLLGQSQGPRFGSFVAIFGIERTIALIESGLKGELG